MFLKSIFGSPKFNRGAADKLVKAINAKEAEVSVLTDVEIKERGDRLKEQISAGADLGDLLVEAFALAREAGKRTLGQRQFDVQLLGGIYLHRGSIIEMLTGEGKTLAVTSPAFLNALTGKGVHVVTVNEYLAKRDAVWMGQIYHYLGLKTACLVHDGAYIYDPVFTVSKGESRIIDKERDMTGSFLVQEEFLRPVSRKEAYLADITYGTNHEFGFDYLRDNLVQRREDQVSRPYNFAVIDEVDSILIDEARTPLIIAAPDQSSSEFYKLFSRTVSRLKEGEDYLFDEKNKSVDLTETGIDKVEKLTGVKDIFSAENIRLVHYLEACLKAKELFLKDRDYVVKNGEIIIVDQFTGRLMFGRRYSAGLHQAIEAKEGVGVQEESRTYAQITIQNFFRLYKKIAGMTGTARTSAEEFHKVYNLSTVGIPPNRPLIRRNLPDVIYKTAEARYRAMAAELKKRQSSGQPVLIGTTSIEKNELLAGYLSREGISFEILNAKNNEREATIIAQAGREAAVTLATNMAGRGVDIILGGNPPNPEEAQKVKNLGGLHVVGTERHEARRIDNQLRGRAGRQGDPGSSQFFLSLEDDLLRIFGGDRLKALMQSFKIPDDQPIESSLVSRAVAEAQRKVEGLNFDMRKHLLEYDDVLNKQRMNIYRRRQELLEADEKKIREIIRELFVSHSAKKNEDLDCEELEKKINKLKNVLSLKQPMLMVLDMLWMNHLEDIEALIDSVRIRAYGQHDPLVEYRRESHILFSQLVNNFEDWVVDNIFKIQIQLGTDSDQRTEVASSRSGKEFSKVGRNDPCPCGSGKKYKRCHGR
jgi:preprotein translocase subunit SecA